MDLTKNTAASECLDSLRYQACIPSDLRQKMTIGGLEISLTDGVEKFNASEWVII